VTELFDREVDSWSGLYESDSQRRYALFQGHARWRIQHRRDLALGLLQPEPGMTVLDVGCGAGALALGILERGAHWIGVDAAREMLRRAKLALADAPGPALCAHARALRLPVSDGALDAIACIGVINFQRRQQLDPQLREFWRALRPGGRLVMSSLRLDVLTWSRSRMFPKVPLPWSTPGPLYLFPPRLVEETAARIGFRGEQQIAVRKYLGLPHYTLFSMIRPGD